MNTIPPVSLSPDIQQEVYKAKQQIAEVSQVLNDTPNVNVPIFVYFEADDSNYEFQEILTGSRARRRMDAFIETNVS